VADKDTKDQSERGIDEGAQVRRDENLAFAERFVREHRETFKRLAA
jgi:hypothetical protein